MCKVNIATGETSPASLLFTSLTIIISLTFITWKLLSLHKKLKKTDFWKNFKFSEKCQIFWEKNLIFRRKKFKLSEKKTDILIIYQIDKLKWQSKSKIEKYVSSCSPVYFWCKRKCEQFAAVLYLSKCPAEIPIFCKNKGMPAKSESQSRSVKFCYSFIGPVTGLPLDIIYGGKIVETSFRPKHGPNLQI